MATIYENIRYFRQRIKYRIRQMLSAVARACNAFYQETIDITILAYNAFIQFCRQFGQYTLIFLRNSFSLIQALGRGLVNMIWELPQACISLVSWILRTVKKLCRLIYEGLKWIFRGIFNIFNTVFDLPLRLIRAMPRFLNAFFHNLGIFLFESIKLAKNLVVGLFNLFKIFFINLFHVIGQIPHYLREGLHIAIEATKVLLRIIKASIELLWNILTTVTRLLLNAADWLIQHSIQPLALVVGFTLGMVAAVFDVIFSILLFPFRSNNELYEEAKESPTKATKSSKRQRSHVYTPAFKGQKASNPPSKPNQQDKPKPKHARMR